MSFDELSANAPAADPSPHDRKGWLTAAVDDGSADPVSSDDHARSRTTVGVTTLESRTLILPDGTVKPDVAVVHRPDAVGMVALRFGAPGPDGTRPHEVLLVHQYRAPFGERVWELPAGKIDDFENSRDTAVRELAEETGWRAGALESLTDAPLLVSPGYSTERMHLYLAAHLTPGPQRPEDAHIRQRWVPLTVALTLCGDEILDHKTIVGLHLAALRLGVLRHA